MITLLIWICLFPFLKYAILADLNLYYCAVLVNHDTLYKDCLNSKKTIPEYHEERCKEMIKDGEECNRLYRRISRETTTTLAFRHTVSQNQNRKKVNRNRRNNSKFSSKENKFIYFLNLCGMCICDVHQSHCARRQETRRRSKRERERVRKDDQEG
ncbi:uncharacterized protein [Drosophila tropicalis]|uniref:uncharacterized protein isoform X2 n=1 Tax=Drosophila tropicalis TaxID=46794 RepID=UPI0035ABE0DD